jgi:hypothetical protein
MLAMASMFCSIAFTSSSIQLSVIAFDQDRLLRIVEPLYIACSALSRKLPHKLQIHLPHIDNAEIVFPGS